MATVIAIITVPAVGMISFTVDEVIADILVGVSAFCASLGSYNVPKTGMLGGILNFVNGLVCVVGLLVCDVAVNYNLAAVRVDDVVFDVAGSAAYGFGEVCALVKSKSAGGLGYCTGVLVQIIAPVVPVLVCLFKLALAANAYLLVLVVISASTTVGVKISAANAAVLSKVCDNLFKRNVMIFRIFVCDNTALGAVLDHGNAVLAGGRAGKQGYVPSVIVTFGGIFTGACVDGFAVLRYYGDGDNVHRAALAGSPGVFLAEGKAALKASKGIALDPIKAVVINVAVFAANAGVVDYLVMRAYAKAGKVDLLTNAEVMTLYDRLRINLAAFGTSVLVNNAVKTAGSTIYKLVGPLKVVAVGVADNHSFATRGTEVVTLANALAANCGLVLCGVLLICVKGIAVAKVCDLAGFGINEELNVDHIQANVTLVLRADTELFEHFGVVYRLGKYAVFVNLNVRAICGLASSDCHHINADPIATVGEGSDHGAIEKCEAARVFLGYYINLVATVIVGAALEQVPPCVVANVGYGNDLAVLINLKRVIVAIRCSGDVVLVGSKIGICVYGVLDLGVIKGIYVICNDRSVNVFTELNVKGNKSTVLIGLDGQFKIFEDLVDLILDCLDCFCISLIAHHLINGHVLDLGESFDNVFSGSLLNLLNHFALCCDNALGYRFNYNLNVLAGLNNRLVSFGIRHRLGRYCAADAFGKHFNDLFNGGCAKLVTCKHFLNAYLKLHKLGESNLFAKKLGEKCIDRVNECYNVCTVILCLVNYLTNGKVKDLVDLCDKVVVCALAELGINKLADGFGGKSCIKCLYLFSAGGDNDVAVFLGNVADKVNNGLCNKICLVLAVFGKVKDKGNEGVVYPIESIVAHNE